MSSRLAKNKKRETFAEDTHMGMLKNVGLSRTVPVKEIQTYLIPDFDPYQKQVNQLERRVKRRMWRNGRS